jgi:adenylyltransferase/sulfurtransferase
MQATEVIKILTGIGKPLINKILTYNSITHESYMLELERKSISDNLPSNIENFLKTNYAELCGISYFGIDEIDVDEWDKQKGNLLLVDIREAHELPKLSELTHLAIPLSELHNRLNELRDSDVLFVCQSGRRSLQAAMMIKNELESSRAYSLKGGVEELLKQKII